MKQHLLYFMQAGKSGPIKIGYSKDIYNRLMVVQISNAQSIRLLGLIEGSRLQERAIQEQFAGDRIRGEWFQPSRALLKLIKTLPTILLDTVNFEWGDCAKCGREACDRHRDDDGLIRQYCRKCLMKIDGRMAKLIKAGKRKRVRLPVRSCIHCGRGTLTIRKGLCGACNEYFRRTGKMRPLTSHQGKCSRCKVPVVRAETKRCRKCSAYFYRYGVERPKRLFAPQVLASQRLIHRERV